MQSCFSTLCRGGRAGECYSTQIVDNLAGQFVVPEISQGRERPLQNEHVYRSRFAPAVPSDEYAQGRFDQILGAIRLPSSGYGSLRRKTLGVMVLLGKIVAPTLNGSGSRTIRRSVDIDRLTQGRSPSQGRTCCLPAERRSAHGQGPASSRGNARWSAQKRAPEEIGSAQTRRPPPGTAERNLLL